MAEKVIRLTHKIAIQVHLVAESCTIPRSRSRRPVRKLLETMSYSMFTVILFQISLTISWFVGLVNHLMFPPALCWSSAVLKSLVKGMHQGVKTGTTGLPGFVHPSERVTYNIVW